MEDKKSKSIIFAFSMTALLIFSSIGSFGISTKTVDKEDTVQKTNSNLKGTVARIKITSMSVTTSTIISKSNKFPTLDESDFNISENILVAGEDGNESYPSMVVSGHRALVAYEYEDDSDPYIFLRKSNNFGQNWSEATKLLVKLDGKEISVNSPTLCINPKNKDAYGAFFSKYNTSGIHGIFDIPDISSFGNIDVKIWDWSELGFWNFSDPDIVYHYKENATWIAAFTGSTTYADPGTGEGPCNNSLMVTCLVDENPDFMVITWSPEIENCSNVSMDIDDASEILYGFFEIKNTTNQDLLFFSGFYDYDEQNNPFINVSYKTFNNGPENLTHPKINVKGDQIYMVAETDANGKNDIIIFNSSDEGDTWENHIVTENQPPEAAFSCSLERLNVTFFDKSTDIDGYITSRYWEYGDGTNSTDENPQHDYDTPGTYLVNLTVKDNENASSTISKIIILDNTTPIADFTYTPINPSANENITFNSTSTAHPSYFIENYTWDFGDESGLVYEQGVQHQYADNGTYIVNLTVRDNKSATDSIEKTIKVGLVADFTYSPDIPSISDTIYFNDSSSVPEGSMITNWTWDFGDSTSLVYQQNTTHQYMTPGVYIVNLTIKDVRNSTDSILKQIIVKPGLGSFIPRYPMVFANEISVFCCFTFASNIFITNSSDHGGNWNDLKQLNDQIYSVVEEYRYTDMPDMPDMSHVIWTDNRNGNNDIYSVILVSLEMDLMIIPDSVKLARDDTFWFFETNNWIEFTVINNGNSHVENVPIEIEYICLNQDPKLTEHPAYIKYLEGNGAKIPFRTSLFRIAIGEFLNALINFVGIQNITVTVDPGNTIGDINPSNNVYTITNVTYGKIFPRLAWLEDFL